jgi:hypothetical protein
MNELSQYYLDYLTEEYPTANQLSSFSSYRYDSIWVSPNWMISGDVTLQNGFIGKNFQRIQIYISKVHPKKGEPTVYCITGKSKVKTSICDFHGFVKLLKLTDRKNEASDYSKCGHLIGIYTFYEDSTQQNSGYFKGIMDCDVYINTTQNQIGVDQTLVISDFYKNRTYVGTWTSYKTGLSKVCIWGDDRLPYTYGFMKGDGEMYVTDKYKGNGWESFNNGSEYIQDSNGKYSLKDKWWLP